MKNEKDKDTLNNQPSNINEEKKAEETNKKNKKKNKNELEELKNELEEAKKQIEELQDKYIRLLADFDNYKKRNARERLELVRTAGEELIKELLPVLDDFERAFKNMDDSEELKAFREGFSLIFNKLKSKLGEKGLKEMESVGKAFDSEYHEAIAEVPVEAEEDKGKVVDEVEKGYFLNDKIIRHAKVVVGK